MTTATTQNIQTAVSKIHLHTDGTYSVTIEIDKAKMVELTHSGRGCETKLTIYNMTPDEIVHLGHQLIDAGSKAS